jgi:iron complex outermembrane receptor protein
MRACDVQAARLDAISPLRGGMYSILTMAAGLVAACGVMAPMAAMGAANSAAADAEVAQAPTSSLIEVVITARRVSERLQDVPDSVAAVGHLELADRQVMELNDIVSFIPNLQTVQTAVAGGGAIAIRGAAGAGLPNATADSPVGHYIDGIYIARQGATNFEMPDIDHVEVLRGPQGTLFGRNATAGAVNFITAVPTGKFGADVEGTFGNYNRRRGRITLNLPEAGGLSARLSYMLDEQDGVQQNLAGGSLYAMDPPFGTFRSSKRFWDKDDESVFAALRYTGIDKLTVTYKFDHSYANDTPPGAQALGIPSGFSGLLYAIYLSAQPAGAVPISFHNINALPLDFQGPSKVRNTGHNLTADYTVDDKLSVKNIFGYRQTYAISRSDVDGGNLTVGVVTPLDPLNFLLPRPQPPGSVFCAGCALNLMEQHQWSDELQLIGASQKLDYILGLYAFHEDATMDIYYSSLGQYLFPGGAPNPTIPFLDLGSGGNDHAINKANAAYGSVKYRPVDRAELSAGLRYTKDDRSTVEPGPAPAVSTFYQYNAHNVSYDASASYKFTDDMLGYVRYATGYLSGGVMDGAYFKPEKTQSTEAGLKSEFLDNTLLLNVSVFHSETRDLQNGSFQVGFGLQTQNIGKTTTNGFELESNYRATRELTVGANVGYNNPKYSNGRDNPNPRINGTGYAQFDLPDFGNSSHLRFRADADYRGKYHGVYIPLVPDATPARFGGPFSVPAFFLASQGFTGPNAEANYLNALYNAAASGGYWMANARLSWVEIPVGDWQARVSLWVKNIADKRALFTSSNYGNAILGSFTQPRTFGIDVGVTF